MTSVLRSTLLYPLKRLRIVALVTFFVLFKIPLSFAGGGMTSGGLGDKFHLTKETFNAAWFLGDAPVKYCLKVSKTFSMPENSESNLESIRSVLKNSLGDWLVTINELNRMAATARSPYHLATQFSEVECGHGEDLTFYFGVVEDDVKTLLDTAKIAPAAFSFIRSYDEQKGRAKGYVWMCPDQLKYRFQNNGPLDGRSSPQDGWWSAKGRVKLVLMHEIGHIFGIPHTGGSFMDPNLTQLFSLPRPFNVSAMGSSQFLSMMSWFYDGSRLCTQLQISFTGVFRSKEVSTFNQIFGSGVSWHDGGRLCVAKSYEGMNFVFQRLNETKSKGDQYTDQLWIEPGLQGTFSNMQNISLDEDPFVVYAKPSEVFLSLQRMLKFTAQADWLAADGTPRSCPVEFSVYAHTYLNLSFKCDDTENVRFIGRDRLPMFDLDLK